MPYPALTKRVKCVTFIEKSDVSELRDVLEVIEKILDKGGSTLVIVKQVPFYSREDSQRLFDELKRLLDESKELGSEKRPKEKSKENKSSKQVWM